MRKCGKRLSFRHRLGVRHEALHGFGKKHDPEVGISVVVHGLTSVLKPFLAIAQGVFLVICDAAI